MTKDFKEKLTATINRGGWGEENIKEAMPLIEGYIQEQLNIGFVSDCNMQEFMNYYGDSKHVFTDKAIDVLKNYKR